MTNVVQFKRKVVYEAAKTKWDEVYNECGELPEYKLVALMLAMSWCYQTGRGPMGDRFLAAARASGFAQFIQLEKELGDLIENIDMRVAMYGTEVQRAEQ